MKDLKYQVDTAKLEEQIDTMKNREIEKEKEIMEKLQKIYEERYRKGGSPTKSARSPHKTPKQSPMISSRKNMIESASKSKFNLELIGEKSEEKKNFDYDMDFSGQHKIIGHDDEDFGVNEMNGEDSNFIDTMSRDESNTENPYTRLIMELKNQIKYLESVAVLKDEQNSSVKMDFERYKYDNIKTVEALKNDVEAWKFQYNSLLVKNQTLYDQFLEMVDKREQTIKETQVNQDYELKKKIMHLENVNAHLTIEMDRINEMNLSFAKDNENKINRINEQNSKLLVKYEELWKTYEVDLNALTDMVIIIYNC